MEFDEPAAIPGRGHAGLGVPYETLKARWVRGERGRELGLRLMYLAWMNWADPPFVTGLEGDPASVPMLLELFDYLGGESSEDGEFLFVAYVMLRITPYIFGDARESLARADRMEDAFNRQHPSGISPSIFEGRGEYGRYFAHQADGRFSGPPDAAAY